MKTSIESFEQLTDAEVKRLRKQWLAATAREVVDSGLHEFLDRMEVGPHDSVRRLVIRYAKKMLRHGQANDLQNDEKPGKYIASLVIESMANGHRRTKSHNYPLELRLSAVDPIRYKYYGIRLAAQQRRDFKSVQEIFGDHKRLYFRLAAEHSTKAEVSGYLQNRGFTVFDYSGGYAIDAKGKQQFRIGKLLQGNPDLSRQFNDDPMRSKDNFLVVFSRLPIDIARVSVGRAWSSCLDPNSEGDQYDRIYGDISRGSLVAYLIKEGDPAITQPLARILIKPFRPVENRDSELFITDKVYGFHSKSFIEMTEAFASSLNRASKPGFYSVDYGLYVDKEKPRFIDYDGHKITPIPIHEVPARQFLQSLGVPFHISGEGENESFVVNDSLNLSGMGLTKLPDLSKVTVRWDLNMRGNHLTSLAGCPQIVQGDFDCSGNYITDFSDGPKAHRKYIKEWNPRPDPTEYPIQSHAIRTARFTMPSFHNVDPDEGKFGGVAECLYERSEQKKRLAAQGLVA